MVKLLSSRWEGVGSNFGTYQLFSLYLHRIIRQVLKFLKQKNKSELDTQIYHKMGGGYFFFFFKRHQFSRLKTVLSDLESNYHLLKERPRSLPLESLNRQVVLEIAYSLFLVH